MRREPRLRRRALIQIGGSLLAASALARHGAVAGAEEPPAEQELKDRDAQLEALVKIIATSVARRDTQHPVFHGCYDWHSAVHGHWAILRAARATGQFRSEAQAIVKALDPDRLRVEAEELRKSPDFEMPYGRAWFLRLAVDYELWAARDNQANVDRLRSFGDLLADSLVSYYRRRTPSPATREYANDSWALVQLYEYLSHRKQTESLAGVKKLIADHFVAAEALVTFAQDRQSPDFFSRFGNWAYLLAKTQEPPAVAAFLRQHPLADDDLRPVDPLLRPAHHLGVNWSRAWALRAVARQCDDLRERERLAAAYRQHVDTGWRHHQKYSGNYGAYDHWVPQFAVYALTE